MSKADIDARTARLIELWNAGKTRRQIADEIGVSFSYMNTIIHRLRREGCKDLPYRQCPEYQKVNAPVKTHKCDRCGKIEEKNDNGPKVTWRVSFTERHYGRRFSRLLWNKMCTSCNEEMGRLRNEPVCE